ncbi:hypothetical protein BVRB_030240, partial [Beta vulgaris subsp. vulgaris]
TTAKSTSKKLTTVKKSTSKKVTTAEKSTSKKMTTAKKSTSKKMATTKKVTTAKKMTSAKKSTSKKLTTVFKKSTSKKVTTAKKSTSKKMTTVKKSTSKKVTTGKKSTSKKTALSTGKKSTSKMMTTGVLTRWKCLNEWVNLNSNYTVTRADWTYIQQLSSTTTGRVVANIEYKNATYNPNMPFFAKVHNDSCLVRGGGVLRINPAIAHGSQTNELWFNMSMTATTPNPYTVNDLVPNSPRLANMNLAKSIVIKAVGGS